MTTGRRIRSALVLALLACGAVAPAGSQELGTITFPTSGAPAAQAAFLEGVKSLHSFQFAVRSPHGVLELEP